MKTSKEFEILLMKGILKSLKDRGLLTENETAKCIKKAEYGGEGC